MDAGTPFDVTAVMLVPSLLVAGGPSSGALVMGVSSSELACAL